MCSVSGTSVQNPVGTLTCDGAILNVSSSPGYLASHVTRTQRYGPGSPRCPWSVRALPGQRINVTLHDFTAPAVPSPPVGGTGSGMTGAGGTGSRGHQQQQHLGDEQHHQQLQHQQHQQLNQKQQQQQRPQATATGTTMTVCPPMAQLREETGSRDSEHVIRACDSRDRKRLVYTSRGNRLKVVIYNGTGSGSESAPAETYFVLYFQGRKILIKCTKEYLASY